MIHCADHQSCRQAALEAAEQHCAEAGLRLTELRRRVLALVWESHQPVKAYDLMAKLPRDGASPAQPPTVYRALDFLRENGLIHRLDSINAYIGCSHPRHHEDCYFLLCEGCGLAEECCTPTLAEAIRHVGRERNFSATTTTLEITGLCSDCQNHDPANPAS
ncbi:MAG: Fur family transcriptional regulator [Candidatus Puniceispirillales bacterium]